MTLELRNTTGKNTHHPRWYTHISQLTLFMPPPETYKVNSGVNLRCARSMPVHTSHYSRLEKLTIPIATQERLPCTSKYILHAVSITTHTHDRRQSIGEKKQRKEKKIKERKGKRIHCPHYDLIFRIKYKMHAPYSRTPVNILTTLPKKSNCQLCDVVLLITCPMT